MRGRGEPAVAYADLAGSRPGSVESDLLSLGSKGRSPVNQRKVSASILNPRWFLRTRLELLGASRGCENRTMQTLSMPIFGRVAKLFSSRTAPSIDGEIDPRSQIVETPAKPKNTNEHLY